MCCALLALGCAGDGRETRSASIDGLAYSVPAEWQSKNQSEHQTKIALWTPDDNDRKESVAIVRTRAMPALVHADFQRIQQLLSDAQKNLPRGSFGVASRFKSQHGLTGARIAGSFVPDGGVVHYHRFHAVVIDRDSLVHVIYTATDANQSTFDLVLDSLARKGS